MRLLKPFRSLYVKAEDIGVGHARRDGTPGAEQSGPNENAEIRGSRRPCAERGTPWHGRGVRLPAADPRGKGFRPPMIEVARPGPGPAKIKGLPHLPVR